MGIEPVWYLPGIAKRFGVEEAVLRQSLFQHTNGMYPELITRTDLKVYMPPIGGNTIYIFGEMEAITDPAKTLCVRVHDECNGSDSSDQTFARAVRTLHMQSRNASGRPRLVVLASSSTTAKKAARSVR